MNRQKVIVRFIDGRVEKGFVADFSPEDDFVFMEDESSERRKIRIDELKAIFFVKTFEGNKTHVEKKSFTSPLPKGKRIFVRFKDGESMMGYREGDLPWEKGFFLEPHKKMKGFFLVPVDRESNNIKVYVVATSVRDVAQIG